tara:strand:- start:392 stop:511 length:120 start_codon:yes stop_codon:yes gene_type:complete
VGLAVLILVKPLEQAVVILFLVLSPLLAVVAVVDITLPQ